MPMAQLHDLHDRPRDGRGGALGVPSPGDDPVEELPSLAELHDEVDSVVVLARLAERHDAGAPRQVAHDRHLAADVLDVDGGPQLPLRDALAGQQLPRAAVDAEVRHAELAAPELPVHQVLLLDVLLRNAGEDRDRRIFLFSGAGGRVFGVVVAGEGGFDVLAGYGGGGSAAVAHSFRRDRAAAVLVVVVVVVVEE